MEKYFLIDNYNVKIKNLVLLNSISLSLKHNTVLLGESGTGKTILIKNLSSNKNIYQTNGKVAFYFNEQTAYDENIFSKCKDPFYKKFLKDKNPYKASLCLKLLEKPDFLICEQLNLPNKEMKNLLNYLRKNNIIMLYVTNNIEEVPFFDYIIVIKNNHIAIEGETKLVLNEERLMKRLGYNLPFYANMSKQLSYYGLLNELYLNEEEMESALWQSK